MSQISVHFDSAFKVGKGEESFLSAVQLALKLYDHTLEPIRQTYSLSKLELIVVGFLHNNPKKDTVGEIATLRSLSKGNVSCAVDSLVEKGYVQRKTDTHDRRTAHLSLQEKAAPIVKDIASAEQAYKDRIFFGFSEQDKAEYKALFEKMLYNMKTLLSDML